jgi:catechol 2,3-dioxygenase-like lactoylglutathione lyase family enzyme
LEGRCDFNLTISYASINFFPPIIDLLEQIARLGYNTAMLTQPIQAAITFLKTTDLQATTRFYTQVLGLELALDQGSCRIFRIRPGALLGFCTFDSAPTAGVPTANVILTLVVEDVDQACAELEAAGAPIEVRPRLNQRYNIYQFFARDPNGYLIEVQRFLDPAWTG